MREKIPPPRRLKSDIKKRSKIYKLGKLCDDNRDEEREKHEKESSLKHVGKSHTKTLEKPKSYPEQCRKSDDKNQQTL